MKKAGIFYSSATVPIQKIAQHIAEELHIDRRDMYDVSELTPDRALRYDLLMLGVPTSAENEIPAEWKRAIDILKKSKLSGKTVALFGCGSSHTCGGSFCHTLQLLHKELQATGVSFIKTGPGMNCTIDLANAFDSDKLIGLAIDEMNDGSVTDQKVEQWVNIINNNRNNDQ